MSLLIVTVLASLLSGAHAAGAHGSYSRVYPRVIAQTPSGQQGSSKKKDAQPGKRTAPPTDDPLAAQRRVTAVSLLMSLADKARNFRDMTLRARAQARAADALWDLDPEQSRALFRRAWADADAADREIKR